MKLSRLELSGFKSFADYTEFVFDDGITGIVGPNGCGKSNVVDAVKWVLGEMSAKSLRGDAMLDVIFNGSGGRKPMGMAEVSLTFSNEDRRLPLDADTVKVTRRLYRDATSEYLINNQMSRLKDIRELFLDTGIGVDAYSLIEQGRVAALLDSNTQDRREIFEEAAGISRFKQRKKEALRKLEKTDQNLAQSQLVLEEVEKQLRSVKVQAGRARNYQEYATRLKELRSAYVMQEYGGLHQKMQGINEQLGDVVDALAAVRRQVEEKRTRQAELQLELESAQDALRKSERDLLAAQNEHASTTQRAEFARHQIGQLSEQRELIAARHADVAERLEHRTADAQRHEQQLAGIDGQLRAHEAAVADAVAKQEQAAKAIAGLNRSVDEQKARAIDLMRQIARLHNDINGLKITQENLANQKVRLEQRKGQIEAQIAELKARVAEFESQKAALTEQSATLQADAAAVREQQQANNQKMAATSQELARQREHRSALKSRQNVLNDLQTKREGVSQVVRDLLKQRDAARTAGNGGGALCYVRGIVADAISTDMEHATMIEAALGDLQNAVIVSDSAALAADADLWRKLAGRVTVLPTDRMLAWQDGYDWSRHGEAGQRAKSAMEFVTPAPEAALLVHQLLGRTVIVDTLADALVLADNGPRDYRFVTRAGEVVENRAFTLGDMSKRGGMITRRAEVAKLERELAEVEARVQELTEAIAACDQTSRALDARQQELRQQIFQTDSRRAEVNAQLQQTASQLQRTTAEAPLIAGEIESLDRQIATAAERQAEAEEKAAALERDQKAVEAVVHELGSQLIVRQHEVSELSEAATAARVAMGQVQEQRSGISRELATARQAVNQLQIERQRLSGEGETVAARITDAEEAVAAAESNLEELAGKLETLTAAVAEATERVAALRSEVAAVGSGLDGLQGEIETHSRREHELSLSKNELSVRIETLIEHTMDELQINLHEAYAEHLKKVETEGENGQAATDWDAVAAEISELKGKISRLGNVNLDAILEQSQLEERQSSLTAQLADIHDAKRQLEELIAKINEDSRTRFAESFAAVRTEFQDMFRKLFGGGKADIILENPDDILESGIEIMARPPGKEPQSMSLLSGGEKTMTAVALVMSIFKSKPSPFCILDEVDAALDEANTTRFAAIIQDFLRYSQFIVITHNKRTMSIADTLYGVTMQEQGVSKRVAVKFDGKGSAVVSGNRPQEQAA
ncbi:MAG TPA: chromosome segregation protein SMC [Phycisphaerae bacterium]|nr:chromosome segregation protein SMC [Phycisphaerae bacterium]